MPETPYRTGYRVEQRVRPLTPEEESLVRERLARWRAQREKNEPHPALELSLATAVPACFAAYGAWKGELWMAVIGAIATLFLVALIVVAARKRRERLAAARGPWHAPEGGWQVCESHLFARSIVGAASGDEDYSQWVLFEIPGGEWFFVEPLSLPDPSADLAREHVSLARLWPHGVWIAASSTGEPIPRHGAKNTEASYPDDVENGWVWNDENAGATELDRVPEGSLPTWIRDVERKT